MFQESRRHRKAAQRTVRRRPVAKETSRQDHAPSTLTIHARRRRHASTGPRDHARRHRALKPARRSASRSPGRRRHARHRSAPRARKKKAYRTTVEVAPKGAAITVKIPRAPRRHEQRRRRRRAGLIPVANTHVSTRRLRRFFSIAGVGRRHRRPRAAVAGVITMLDWNASNSTDNGCDFRLDADASPSTASTSAPSAQTWATVSTVAFITGGVPRSSRPPSCSSPPPKRARGTGLTVLPTVLASGGGLFAFGTF